VSDRDPDDEAEVAVEFMTPIDWSAFWSDQPIESDWVAEPILPARRHVAIWARAKVGKSLLALDVSATLATGGSLFGQPASEPIDVIYLDLEMSEEDVRERLEDLGYGPESDLKRLHYYQLSNLPPLDADVGGRALEKLVRRHNAGLVVIDTIARAVRGEENSADTYRGFYRFTGSRLRALDVSLLRLDHGGKRHEQGQRGSSAKDDDVDVIFEMTQTGDFLILRKTRSRVSWVPNEVKLERREEPSLRHVLAPVVYPPGTKECAADLDRLGVGLDASRRVAEKALRDAGKGRRVGVINAALKYRVRPL
jgi:hypothetical protein